MSIHARFAVSRPGFAMTVDLSLPGQGVTALFGPSGSGKTTLLRAIAGLERHPGALAVNGACWQDDQRRLFLPTHRRPLGYVFQESSLLAHLTVQGNLAFGWKRIAPARRQVGWDAVVELLDIGHLLARLPQHLSGGERQRVAIARALLTSPALLLMDEPLASLDAARKQEVLPYLERLHAELALPILYVSHSADEVARLADHLVLLERGTVLAQGPVGEVSARIDLPQAFDAQAGAVVDGVVSSYEAPYRLLHVQCGGAAVALVHGPLPVGARLRIRVPARDVSLSLQSHADTSLLNQLPARVLASHPAARDGHMLVRLDAGGLDLVARITLQSHERLRIAPGLALWAQFKAAAVLSPGD
jgi:molybdate transport system ATP-binding protein